MQADAAKSRLGAGGNSLMATLQDLEKQMEQFARLSARIANIEVFADHYQDHIVPHICRGIPLDQNCRYCSAILKQKRENNGKRRRKTKAHVGN